MTTALWAVLGKPAVIDLSHNNRDPIDFAALYADGVRLAILKASQGTGFVDPAYAKRRIAAQAAGIIVDAYHFCDGTDPKLQARHFFAAAAPDESMRLAIDCEPNKGSSISFAQADQMADLVDQHRGRQCLRYTGAGFLIPSAINQTPHFRKGPIWWAKYGPQPSGAQLAVLGIDPDDLVLWQETSTGSRPGIKGPVDESYFLGTLEQLALWPALPRFPDSAPKAA